MRFSALAALGCASCRRSDAATALSAALSATVGARLSVGVAWGGADAGTRMEAFCNKMAPNTATHSTIASADAIAARRMSDLQPKTLRPLPNERNRAFAPPLRSQNAQKPATEARLRAGLRTSR